MSERDGQGGKWVGVWADGCTDGQMNIWMDKRVGVYMHVCVCFCVYVYAFG